MGQGSGKMNLEEIIFEEIPQEYQGKSIKEINFRDKTGANIVGLKLPTGEYIINPDPALQIKPGTKIFVLGDSNQIEAFKNVMKLKEQM
jgi:voltage-gated potassium channel